MPVDFPIGIAAQGNGALWWLPAILVQAAPTAAEFAAGINVSCAIDGFNPATEQGTTAISRYCSTQAYETPGRVAVTGPTIQFVYDPQDPAAPEYEWKSTIVEGTVGFLVNRLGISAQTDAAATQVVNVYPTVAGPQPPVPLDPTAEGAEIRYAQRFFITGPVTYDAVIAA